MNPSQSMSLPRAASMTQGVTGELDDLHEVPQAPVDSWFSGHLKRIVAGGLDLQRALVESGPIARFRIFHRTVVVVTEPRLVNEVLIKKRDNLRKGIGLQVLSRLFGKGILTSEGRTWKRARKLMAPSFKPARVTSYVETMAQCVDEHLATWRDGDVRDITADMTLLTFEIGCRTLIGSDARRARDAVLELTAASQRFFEEWRSHFLPFADRFPTAAARRYRRAIREMDAVAAELIADRRSGRVEDDGILSQLVAARDENGRGLTDKEIRDQLVTLLLAAHETSAAAASWALLLIHQNPQVERTLRAELDERLQGAAPTAKAMRGLSYLFKILKESMRLYPAISSLNLTSNRAFGLGRWKIPTNAEIVVPVTALHRSPKYYDDPDAFIPERWTKAMQHALPKGVYLPFGRGGRVCIGQNMATIEVAMIVATILQRYRLEPLPGTRAELHPGVTDTPRPGSIKMRATALPQRERADAA